MMQRMKDSEGGMYVDILWWSLDNGMIKVANVFVCTDLSIKQPELIMPHSSLFPL